MGDIIARSVSVTDPTPRFFLFLFQIVQLRVLDLELGVDRAIVGSSTTAFASRGPLFCLG